MSNNRGPSSKLGFTGIDGTVAMAYTIVLNTDAEDLTKQAKRTLNNRFGGIPTQFATSCCVAEVNSNDDGLNPPKFSAASYLKYAKNVSKAFKHLC